MTTAVATPAAENTRRELNLADRCDRCGAQAFIHVAMPSGFELLFCGHHGRKNEVALRSAGATVHDHTGLINAKSNSSANAE